MKVAHIVSTFYPHVGGMGEVCLTEVSDLQKAGFKTTVFSLFYPHANYQDNFSSFSVVRLKSVLKFGDAGWIRGLEDKLKDFDIVHLHFPFYGAERAVLKAKKKYGFKLVITYHMDAQVRGIKKILRDLLDFFYGRKLFEIADKIIYVDEERFKKCRFFNELVKLKAVYLPNAVDINIFKPQEVTWEGLGLEKYKDKKIILFVGNLLPIKNLEVVIKAMPEVEKDAILLVVGGGYAERRYKKMVQEAGLSDRVIFYGPEKDKEVLAKIYNLAYVLVVPSHYESFSLSALEALASGVPVIANNIAGVRGRITHGVDGILLAENTKIQWVNALNSVLNYNKGQKEIIAQKARQKVINNYSVEKHIDKLVEIYKN